MFDQQLSRTSWRCSFTTTQIFRKVLAQATTGGRRGTGQTTVEDGQQSAHVLLQHNNKRTWVQNHG